jgi:hypothetical protein
VQITLPVQYPMIMPYTSENAPVEYRASPPGMFMEGQMIVRVTNQKPVAFRKADLPFDLYKYLGGAPADENKMVNAAKNQIAVKVLCRADVSELDSEERNFSPMWYVSVAVRTLPHTVPTQCVAG